MTALWSAVVLASLACYGLKLAGVSLPRGVLDHPRVRRVAVLLPVAMLAALVAVELVDAGEGLGWDWPRAAGVGAGVVALLLRQGVLTVFTVAVVVTALVRFLL
jgi:branched-subunit amino acid transport protein